LRSYDESPGRGRRAVLRCFAASGIGAPAVVFGHRAHAALHAVESPMLSAGDAEPSPGARSFVDPLLELISLLRAAAELQHASLLQYSYAAFSLKPAYEAISGYSSKDAMSLLMLAIDRMKHLGVLNRMLNMLGAPPQLAPPSFPFAGGGYPFRLTLEPLSRAALARHIWREAPAALFDSGNDSSDAKLVAGVCKLLDLPARRAGIYPAIVAAASEVQTADPDLPDLARWTDALRLLEQRGRDDRFRFLKELFLATDPAFAGHDDVWRLPVTDPVYPAYDIASNPASHADRLSQGSDAAAALVRLGNIQYNTTLLLLDLFFRHHLPTYRSLAVEHMTGPVRSLGRYLPRLGAAMPFESIDVPDASALDAKRRLRFVMALLHEGQAAADALGPRLPPDYPLGINRDTMAKLADPGMPGASGPVIAQ
jgi:hypothetical protein